MRLPLVVAAPLIVLSATIASAETVTPFEAEAWSVPASHIDQLVAASLAQRGIAPANPCSDEVFFRRASIDVIGTVPTAGETIRFLRDRRPDKRAALIEGFFARDEFADYWSLKWCDVLRVKAEFPINLWPNAVQAYHRWVRDSIVSNKPYDRMARELLTSSGSNFREAPVNFYRAIQGREPSAIAEAVALAFMGSRTANWPEDRRAGLTALFSRLQYKKTGEWKEEIVCADPAKVEAFSALLPDGTTAHVAAGQDPRQVFTNWLITEDNPWFSRCVVNRIWAWLFGRGIVHEADDTRPDNPPANEELLAYLAGELANSGYDLRHIYRLILNSRTYQQSSIPQSDSPEAEVQFAYYPVRRLDAEVLIDALCWIGGQGETYSSAVPEPFTYTPADQRTIALSDGSITSQFLEMFGRPARDTGLLSERNNEPTDAQRLHLLNSTDIQRRITLSPVLNQILLTTLGDPGGVVRLTYLTLLSRRPTEPEMAAALACFGTGGVKPKEAAEDLAWALVNSKEFLYRH